MLILLIKFTHSFIRSPVHPFIRSSICSFVCSLIGSAGAAIAEHEVGAEGAADRG